MKIEITANKADAKNKEKYKISSLAKTITSSIVTQRLKTNISPAEIPATNNKYIVCIL